MWSTSQGRIIPLEPSAESDAVFRGPTKPLHTRHSSLLRRRTEDISSFLLEAGFHSPARLLIAHFWRRRWGKRSDRQRHSAGRVVRAAVAHGMQEGRSWEWKRAIALTRQMLAMSMISNCVGLVVAVICGWANPFVRHSTHEGHHLFITRLVLDITVLCIVASCAGIGFFLYGEKLRRNPSSQARSLPILHCAWIVLRLSFPSAIVVVGIAVGVARISFMAENFSFVHEHSHSLLASSAVFVHGVDAIARVVRFRASKTISCDVVCVPNTPSNISSTSITRGPHRFRRKMTWQQSIRIGLKIAAPAFVAAVVGMQYTLLGKHLNLNVHHNLLVYAIGSVVLKVVMQMLIKIFIIKLHENHMRNMFYMVTSPILGIEAQMRMAILQAQAAMPVYVGSAILGVLEIIIRVTTAILDIVVVELVRRRLERRKRTLRSVLNDPSQEQELQIQLSQLDERFHHWKDLHLRLCAIEIRAEIVSEYCGIGFASLFMVILHQNHTFLLTSQFQSRSQLLGRQVLAYVVQMGMEITSDVIASAFEMRIGLPLGEALDIDTIRYMRVTMAVVAIHAGCMCLSSIVVVQPNES